MTTPRVRVSWTVMGASVGGTHEAEIGTEGFHVHVKTTTTKHLDHNYKPLAGARVILAGKDADVAGVPSERLCSIQVSETQLR